MRIFWRWTLAGELCVRLSLYLRLELRLLLDLRERKLQLKCVYKVTTKGKYRLQGEFFCNKFLVECTVKVRIDKKKKLKAVVLGGLEMRWQRKG